jgi:hypothetical protein
VAPKGVGSFREAVAQTWKTVEHYKDAIVIGDVIFCM